MAILTLFADQEVKERINDFAQAKAFLNNKGILLEQWEASEPIKDDANQDDILAAYDHMLDPYMTANGYQVADVVNIHAGIENYPAIRAKFLAEHTHTEDEVRFFVGGQGLFWFNLEGENIFNVLCEAGDLISVPKETKHWFDAGMDSPNVKAIRIFIDQAGWVPHYTDSNVNEHYPQSL